MIEFFSITCTWFFIMQDSVCWFLLLVFRFDGIPHVHNPCCSCEWKWGRNEHKGNDHKDVLRQTIRSTTKRHPWNCKFYGRLPKFIEWEGKVWKEYFFPTISFTVFFFIIDEKSSKMFRFNCVMFCNIFANKYHWIDPLKKWVLDSVSEMDDTDFFFFIYI